MLSSFFAASLRSSSEMVVRMFLTARLLASLVLAIEAALRFLPDDGGMGEGRLFCRGLMVKSVITGQDGVFLKAFLDFGRRFGTGASLDGPAMEGMSCVVEVTAGSKSSFG